jgi:hypothetical protein
VILALSEAFTGIYVPDLIPFRNSPWLLTAHCSLLIVKMTFSGYCRDIGVHLSLQEN